MAYHNLKLAWLKSSEKTFPKNEIFLNVSGLVLVPVPGFN